MSRAGVFGASGVAIALAVFISSAPAAAQRRPRYFDQAATVRVVGTPQPGESLPLLIALPPTGVDAAWFFAVIAPAVPWHAYAVMLPAGAPTRAEYSDFGRFTTWFDARVQTDLGNARTQFAIDPARVYLAGFSLGGDLAWALLGRHPELFHGALVLGSRCSAPMSPAALAMLRAHGAHVVFGIGLADLSARVNGLLAAANRVRSAGISARILRYPGGHLPPGEPSVIVEALRALTE